MTMERFQGIVLRLANQTMVRCYYHLNYPHDPQLFGLLLLETDRTLRDEIEKLGFEWNEVHRRWTVERTPEGEGSGKEG